MTMTRRRVLASAAAALAAPSALAQSIGLPSGPSDYPVDAAIGERRFAMRVFVNVPTQGSADRPVLFVMHGVNRDADRYRDEWKALSEQHAVVIVVPQFDSTNFPKREVYNFGGVVDREVKVRPQREWIFPVIYQIFADFVSRSGSKAADFDLYGHSAGAQFSHRFALLGGSPRVRRVVIANAGSYSMPVFDKPFPWGLGGIGLGEGHLSRVLSLEGIVMLGDKDTDPNHSALPRDPEAMAQGLHRFARGTAFFDALDAAAKRRPFRFAWRKVIVPGVAHDNAGMAIAAAQVLYGSKKG